MAKIKENKTRKERGRNLVKRLNEAVWVKGPKVKVLGH